MRRKSCISFLLLLCAYIATGQKVVNLNNGKFKIVQFTDIHYKASNPASKESIALIKEVLSNEKPDLVALTGDIVTMSPCLEGWDDILNAIEELKIPWAAVFGNHDDEHDKTRSEIMEYIAKRKYALSSKGPEDIKGVGNYIVEVSDGKAIKFLLYFMDSNAYSHFEGVHGYGWFGHDQVSWYRKQSAEYAKKSGRPIPALAFFHIPLNEYADMTLARKKMVGMKNEPECPPAMNSGMFLAMRECGDVMATFVGHDHDNDYIGKYNGLFLAYGRFSGSKTTYTHMLHGARVIELTAGEEGFKTWIYLKGNQIVNTVNSADFSADK
ncbi:MAG: metallophosphoesterase family protein [Prevotellaceae bacterium]|jgi:3',5'-cyclic AMP phosphodiesterase CpdA|nr:metallophosphoesterase family protein [Prevotellaceae bacterium]